MEPTSAWLWLGSVVTPKEVMLARVCMLVENYKHEQAMSLARKAVLRRATTVASIIGHLSARTKSASSVIMLGDRAAGSTPGPSRVHASSVPASSAVVGGSSESREEAVYRIVGSSDSGGDGHTGGSLTTELAGGANDLGSGSGSRSVLSRAAKQVHPQTGTKSDLPVPDMGRAGAQSAR